MRFVIVTGMSGAGKSTALKMLEDMGYFCVDNLPVPLLPKFAEMIAMPDSKLNQAAVGIDISNSSFYNAATRLRKKACQIPEPEKTSYVLDFTSHQEVVKIDIIPSPLLSDFGCMPLLPPYSFLLCPRNIHGTRNDGFRTYTLGSHASRIS